MGRTSSLLIAFLLIVSFGFAGLASGEEGRQQRETPKAEGRSVAEEKEASGGGADSRSEEAREEEEKKTREEQKKAAEEAKKVIVARVNGKEITMFSLLRAMNKIAPKYAAEGGEITPETTEKVKHEALDRLIFEELAVQQAIKQDIDPGAETIDKVVEQIKINLSTEEAYEDYLERIGLSEKDLRKLIERSQRYEIIMGKEVYEKVEVDEKLVRDEYEKEKKKFVLPDNFVVEDVFFLNGDSDEAVMKKAEEILAEIKQKGNDVWQLVLDGTFIVRKISIVKDRHPEIYKAIADMKVGDLSDVIRDRDGLHIVKVSKKEPSRQLTFEEAKSVIERKFLVPAQEKRKADWEQELRKDAKIEILPDEAEKQSEKGK